MPKLLAYLPCEKVVIEDETKNASVASIISEIQLTIPHGAPQPTKGNYAPMPWNIFCLWEWEQQDANSTFETKSVLVSPSGETLFETSPAEFKRESNKNFHRTIDRITGFPIWTPGRVELRLLFRIKGVGEFSQRASYPILVIHGSLQ